MAKKNNVIKVAQAWQINSNPLRNLTSAQIERLLSEARRGNDARLQIAFAEIERQMPIFNVCINKRLAGITNRRWTIEPVDETPQARQQADIVKKMFELSDTLNENGLTEALRHLGMSAFRGRACVKPFVENGELRFRKLENWNVLECRNALYWDPEGKGVDDFETAQLIPDTEVCWVKNQLPVDVSGIQIYLRQLVGEETWARFVEKQGIPQVLLTAPEGTPDDELGVWNNRAMQIFEGGSGVVPPGTGVNILDSARGQDPFTEFINHQMETISILATGGTLATIGGSSGLGSNLADVQNEQFQSLVSQDCRKIANSITSVVIRKCALSMGQIPLCRFVFVEDDEYSADEYLDMAVKLHGMGIAINARKLKELTKLDFISDDVEETWKPAETPNV